MVLRSWDSGSWSFTACTRVQTAHCLWGPRHEQLLIPDAASSSSGPWYHCSHRPGFLSAAKPTTLIRWLDLRAQGALVNLRYLRVCSSQLLSWRWIQRWIPPLPSPFKVFAISMWVRVWWNSTCSTCPRTGYLLWHRPRPSLYSLWERVWSCHCKAILDWTSTVTLASVGWLSMLVLSLMCEPTTPFTLTRSSQR